MVEYYFKVLGDFDVCFVIVVDLMFVIGNFLIVVVDKLKECGVINICFFCLFVVLEGIKNFIEVYLDVLVYIVVIDDYFNEFGYIMFGFGDVGDCMYGMK